MQLLSLRYLSSVIWDWLTSTGLDLALLVILALLVPRVGRFALWFINRNIEKAAEDDPDAADEGKTQRALAGVVVYIGQLIAYFVLLVFFLQMLGFSLAGAALPATVLSAAIGLGAQSIIADFLAGFFILTEKQFGVGDWVRFEGNGVVVEGTIIQVTMRATRIRTLKQETVIVPNSTAKVCINASNYWSRAVVVIPVPLLGSQDSAEVIARSEAATRRALERPEIARELLGELDVQPGVDIQPPGVVGMPWMIDMRFMIQVTAGNHWMVERAVRTEILDEFWDEYGSATTVSGELRDQLVTTPLVNPEENISRAFRSDPLIDVAFDDPEPEPTKQARQTEDDEDVDKPAELATPPVKLADEQGRDPARTPSETMQPHTDEEEAPGTIELEPVENLSRWRKISTIGGRVRASTTGLLVTLMVLVFFRLLLVEPSEEWLENNPRPAATTAPAEPTPQESEPTASATQPTQEATPTETTGLTLDTETTGPTDTPGQEQQDNTTPTAATQPEPQPQQQQTPAPATTPTAGPAPQQQTQQLQTQPQGTQGAEVPETADSF
ncbi:putative MscS family protein YkuT [Corynebacterium occultum]|uniref:Putative MscS family protein YkuT n=1 Tax=Corynebacterium occultum TaxID=2675219 RepID=A0A6B8WL66_9CORY|nr:mechanosensitive ion channel domain-containing protein [Corynebacterium occultum]QGU07158.1 putative MscS family protein YkuT [Corynebacterium occultum]